MPTDPEDLRIANLALNHLGISPITDFADQLPAAVALNSHYDEWVKELLEDHPWNFAIARVKLEAADKATDPVYEWTIAHTLPADCLRVVALEEEYDQYSWDVEGSTIVHNIGDDVYIKYIKEVTMPNITSPLFKKALAYKIALDLAEAGLRTASMTREMSELYQMALARAKSRNGQERSPRRQHYGSWFNEAAKVT